jgi:hypothetical protein
MYVKTLRTDLFQTASAYQIFKYKSFAFGVIYKVLPPVHWFMSKMASNSPTCSKLTADLHCGPRTDSEYGIRTTAHAE